MFKKLMKALFGRKEPELEQTVGQRLEGMRQERELRQVAIPQCLPVGKHRAPPPRQASASASASRAQPDDIFLNPLHPLNPMGLNSPISSLNIGSHYSEPNTPSPARETCGSSSSSSSSYDSSCSSSSSSSDSGSSDSGSY